MLLGVGFFFAGVRLPPASGLFEQAHDLSRLAPGRSPGTRRPIASRSGGLAGRSGRPSRAQKVGCLRRADGDGEDETPGGQTSQGQERRAGGYAGGEPVIHEDGRTPVEVGIGTPFPAEEPEATLDLR
jgi:hypothetical protein